MGRVRNWVEARVRVKKAGADGKVTKANQTYLVDAMTFSEAEANLVKELGYKEDKEKLTAEVTFTVYVGAELADGVNSVKGLKKVVYEEVVHGDGDKWYACGVDFITKTSKGKEKKRRVVMLVEADSLNSARMLVEDRMSTSVEDWNLAYAKETSIVEVFEYPHEEGETEETR